MLEANENNSEKSRYERERDKIKEFAKRMEVHIAADGYIDPYMMVQMKSNPDLNDRERALVFHELGVKKADEGNYDAAKLCFLNGIKFCEDLPTLHYRLGVVLIRNYKKKKDEKELETAEKELRKAKHLIKEQKLESFLSQELNDINYLLKILAPSLMDYPYILFRSIIDFFERVIIKSIPTSVHNNIKSVESLVQGDKSTVINNNDSSRNISVKGNITASEGSSINLGDVSGTVTTTLNKLPSSLEPDKPGIKELLGQLKSAIESDPNLSNEDKADALELVKTLAEAGQNPKDGVMQKTAQTTIRALKRIFLTLPDVAKLTEAGQTLIPMIAHIFGF